MCVHICPEARSAPVSCMWGAPVREQKPRRPQHRRSSSGARGAPHIITVVLLRHRVPNWQKSNVQRRPPRAACFWIGPACQRREVDGFSRKQGTPKRRAAAMSLAEAFIVLFPTSILCWSIGRRFGSPYKCVALRIAHQVEPGGPRRARLHEAQGVPSQSPATQLLDIQPIRRRWTWGLVMSISWPKRKSRDTTPKPRRRTVAASPPVPQKTSKKTR